MKGGCFDNYYMQMVEYIRRYKGGAEDPVDDGEGLLYTDFPGGDLPRDADGNGNTHYTSPGGANDIRSMTARSAEDRVIFTARCAGAIRPVGNYLRLFVVPVAQAQYGSVLAPYKTKTYLFAPDGTVKMYLNKETTPLPGVTVSVDGPEFRYEIKKTLLGVPVK